MRESVAETHVAQFGKASGDVVHGRRIQAKPAINAFPKHQKAKRPVLADTDTDDPESAGRAWRETVRPPRQEKPDAVPLPREEEPSGSPD